MNSGSAAAGVEGQVIEPSPKLLNNRVRCGGLPAWLEAAC